MFYVDFVILGEVPQAEIAGIRTDLVPVFEQTQLLDQAAVCVPASPAVSTQLVALIVVVAIAGKVTANQKLTTAT
jgi:hypothetical protein